MDAHSVPTSRVFYRSSTSCLIVTCVLDTWHTISGPQTLAPINEERRDSLCASFSYPSTRLSQF